MKSTRARQCFGTIAVATVSPLIILHWLTARAGVSAFGGLSQLISLLPGTIGGYLRAAFYRSVCAESYDDVAISFGTILTHVDTCVAAGTYLGPYCVLGRVTLGKNVLIGSRVSIMNGGRQHGIERLDIPVREQPGEWPRITIGEDTWIGDGAIVMVDVGKHCVVGAGSVVTKPVPDYAIVAGNPACILRYRGEAGAGRTPPVHDSIPEQLCKSIDQVETGSLADR